MLIRFVAKNILSFFESKEFNMLPRPKIRTPQGHKYSLDGVEVLKMSAVYGANGAGKSNLVKAIHLLQKLIFAEISASKIQDASFKFESAAPTPQMLAIEFWQDGQAFYYGVEIENDVIITEELYLSGLGKTNDKLLFERKKDLNNAVKLRFSDEFEKDAKSQLLKSILIEEFLVPSKTIFQWVAKRDNPLLADVKKAYTWFRDTLNIVTPDSKPYGLAEGLDKDIKFRKYTEDTARAYQVGISKLSVEKKRAEDVFKDREDVMSFLRDKVSEPTDGIAMKMHQDGEELLVVKEGNDWVTKQLKITQSDDLGREAEFHLSELSDGTMRLLDLLPAFLALAQMPQVYIIDELERSLHPIMAKELISKFANDNKAKGQLIFTTHESNLLDQAIFRQDEIWFVEKRENGASDLYSLSDFKEHNTIDIRKGYLNGRYGAVPFLATLHDIDWHNYDTN